MHTLEYHSYIALMSPQAYPSSPMFIAKSGFVLSALMFEVSYVSVDI